MLSVCLSMARHRLIVYSFIEYIVAEGERKSKTEKGKS